MDVKNQRKVGIGYSIGEVATLIFELVGAYAVYYMTTVRMVNAGTAGSVMSGATIAAALTSIVIGYIIDRYGLSKRKVSYAAFAITCILFLLFYAPVGFTGGAMVVYLGMTGIFFYVAYNCFITPYDSMGGDIVTDSGVRTFMRTLCTIFIFIGVIFADTISTYIRAWLTGAGMGEYMSWFVMALILVAVSVIAILIALITTKGAAQPQTTAEISDRKGNIVSSYIETLKVKEVRVIFFWSIAYYIVNMFTTTLLLYMGMYVLGLSEAVSATLFVVCVAATIVASPLTPLLSGRLGKKKAFLLMSFVYLIYSIYLLINNQSGLIDGIIYAASFSIVNVVVQSLSFSMLYDVNEVVEFKLGVSKGTETLGLLNGGTAIGYAIGTFLAGQVLSLGGFDGSVLEQSQKTVDFIHYGCVIIPALFVIISALIVLVGYKVNEKNHEKLVEALQLKREGKEYSTEGFEELL